MAATAPRVTRARRLPGSRGLKVAAPSPRPHGVQDAGLCGRLELAPQVADEDVDDVRLDIGRVAPHEVEELVAGEHLPGMTGEGLQQLELPESQAEIAARARGDVPPGVDDKLSRGDRAGEIGAAAAQQRVETGEELLQRERLDEVVVAAGLQSPDAVLDVVTGGEDADGDIDAARAQPPQNRDAVEVGHRDVEDDDRRGPARDGRQRGDAAVGRLDREALEAQGALEGLADRRLVVDDEHAKVSTEHLRVRTATGGRGPCRGHGRERTARGPRRPSPRSHRASRRAAWRTSHGAPRAPCARRRGTP